MHPERKAPHLTSVAREPSLSRAERDDLAGLYRSYSSYVAWFVMRLVGRSDDVPDVVQDVFVLAAERLRTLQNPLAVKAWLATVAVRRAQRLLEWRRVRSAFGFEPETGYERAASPDATPEDRAIVEELYTALDRLPVAERVPWVLRHLHEEPLDRVAELCGCSLATVKRRIAAAQSRLERRLHR